MAGLIQHQGEKGRANENSVQALLAKVLPPSVRVASGEIIDSEGTASAQMDTLILSNTSHPVLFAQADEMMFPVESVLLCIEVKTTLTHEEVMDISKKVQKHKKLISATGSAPIFGVFAHKAGSSPRTVAKWFHELDPGDRPSFFLVNDAAIFGIKDENSNTEYQIVMPFAPKPGESEMLKFGDPITSDVNYWKPIGSPSGYQVRIDHGASMLLFIRATLRALSRQHHAEIEWLESYLNKVQTKRVRYGHNTEPVVETMPPN